MSEGEPIQVVDPLLGLLLGDYQVLEYVGEGGMGVVYRGIQPVVKKRVAIKVLKASVASDETAVQKLLAEAEAVNAIGHRGIIDIFTHGTLPDGRPYIVMEFLDGQPLDTWLAAQGRPPLQLATEMLAQICAPLAAAHRSGVIHRDLKPSNIFLCGQDGERFVKLLDFGLAKRGLGLDGKTAQTSQTEVAGTPDYMAPEQARALEVSPRSDIYALGVIAFEMYTGQLPFHGVTPMDVMMAHVRQRAPRLREVVPGLPQPLESLVSSMMDKAPEKRPQSVEEVRERLEAFAADQGSPLRRASRPDYPAARASPPSAETAADLAQVPAAAPAPAAPARSVLPLLGGLAAVAIVVLSAVLILLPAKAPAPEPIAEPIAEPPREVAAAPVPAPLAPEPARAAAAVAPAAEAEDPLEDLAPLPTVAAKVRPVVKEPPTAQALTARLGRLEARAARHPNLDPSALQYLSRFRIEATAADTAARRAKLARSLDEWERSFLSR